MYFTVPAAEVLHVHRERLFPWGYGHMLIFGSIAATGAGLHVAAYYIAHEAHIAATATVLTVAAPLAVYVLTLFALYTFLVRAVDPFHIALLAGTAALLVLRVLLATIGTPMAVCLVVLMLAPLVPVIGYETLGYRHMASAVQRTLARGQQAVR
jgi:low temperature requirement protein LtrA